MGLDDHTYHFQGDQQLCFIHIPKTAGTSARNTIGSYFGVKTIGPFLWWHDPIWHNPEKLMSYKYLLGHVFYNYYQLLPNPIIITFLRDPVERSISNYVQALREPWEIDTKKDLENMSLEDFCDDDLLVRHVSNVQTHYLGSDFELTIENLKKYDAQTLPPRNLKLDLAKQRLHDSAFFGLTERFEDSMELLTYTFGMHPITHHRKENISSLRLRQEDLAQAVLDKVIELNRLDLDLYEYAQQLFEERHAAMCADLGSQKKRPRPFFSVPSRLYLRIGETKVQFIRRQLVPFKIRYLAVKHSIREFIAQRTDSKT